MLETGVTGRAERKASESKRIVLVQYSGNYGGSTVSGHLIARGLMAAGWEVIVAFGFDGPYVRRFAEDGCAVTIVPHENWLAKGGLRRHVKTASRQIVATQRFVRMLRDIQPAIVYVNSIVSLSAILASRRLGIPCVWHIRELFKDVGGEMRFPPLGGRWLVKRFLRNLPQHVITISDCVRRNCFGACAPDNVIVVPNAVAGDYFSLTTSKEQCRDHFGLPNDCTIVGIPGTLRPVKGHLEFVEAMTQVAAQCSGAVCAITGEGDKSYKRELEEKIAALDIADCVRFLGTVEDMKRFYRACDVVCVPSRSESFGRTVIEAFASGVPVVATAVGGMCETIEHGITGMLVPSRDIDTMAKTITSLLHDREKRETLSAAAIEKAKSEYSTDLYQQRVNAVIEKVLRDRVQAKDSGLLCVKRRITRLHSQDRI